MENESIAVAGEHVPQEERPHFPHVEEVIVHANRQLANPEAAETYRHPELAALDTLQLDSNPKFKHLRSALERFTHDSKSARGPSLHPGKSERWIEVLYSSLTQALTELRFAPKEQQLGYVDRIYAWFMDKTRYVTPEPPTVRREQAPRNMPVSTVRVVQDNSMQARQERMRLRKMDAVPSIESRASSPSKSPVLPPVVRQRAHSFMREPQSAKEIASDDVMEQYISRALLYQHRQLSEYRTRRMSEKLVHQWSVARAKREEELLAKAESSSMRPRGATAYIRSKDSDASIGDHSRSYVSTTIESAKGYVDCRPERQMTESPEPSEPLSAVSVTRLDRMRMASRHVISTAGGVAYIKADRCSLSYYQPTSQNLDSSFLSQLDVSANSEKDNRGPQKVEAMTSIRRKLVSAQVACSYRTLISGLHRPEDMARASPEFLPRGGEYLTSNPFSTLGKKKKKGKKKGKKKK